MKENMLHPVTSKSQKKCAWHEVGLQIIPDYKYQSIYVAELH